jgi:hypothetical protein
MMMLMIAVAMMMVGMRIRIRVHCIIKICNNHDSAHNSWQGISHFKVLQRSALGFNPNQIVSQLGITPPVGNINQCYIENSLLDVISHFSWLNPDCSTSLHQAYCIDYVYIYN